VAALVHYFRYNPKLPATGRAQSTAFSFIDKGEHPECLARIVLIASDIRSVYDLVD
jgi:hypothetical protein